MSKMGERENLFLTNIYLFVSNLNHWIACQLQRNPSKPLRFSSALLAVRKHMELLGWEWPRSSELVTLCLDAGFSSKADRDIINDLTRFLLYPASVKALDEGDWRLEGPSPHLEQVGLPERRTENIRIYEALRGEGFSTRALERESLRRMYDFTALFWDELLDPISIIQGYLANRFAVVSEEAANSQIQKWLRQRFGFWYTNEFKFAMPTLCQKINNIFYSKRIPTVADLHALRSGTISFNLLVAELERALSDAKIPIRGELENSENPYLRLALGFVGFLRFTRVLRSRYVWPLSDSDPLGSDTIDVKVKRPTIQCMSALRGLENSYILARIFGSISEIPGFNFIFRGGILPRTGSGRTFVITGFPGVGKTVLALQKLAGIAARGGIAFYLSFEESYELIVDRLISFGLADNSRFSLISPKDDDELVAKLNHLASQDSRLGVLCLYSSASGQGFSIPEKLKFFRELVESKWTWRAIAIDSVNALRGEDGFERPSRSALQSLVESIEGNGFLGVVISEPDTIVHQDMSYLADTIIELGFEEGARSRWIEIKKCRSQHYHAGQHPCQIQEGRGLKIYPSLPAVRSALRRRAKSTLSEMRRIPLPKEIIHDNTVVCVSPLGLIEKPNLSTMDSDGGGLRGASLEIAEKSSSLIYGPANTAKTDFVLQLALAKPLDVEIGEMEQPRSMLLVTFRTTERSFEQGLRVKREFLPSWNNLKYRKVRWYSPGTNISAEHIISDCRKAIKDCRRQGYPLERIVFDELESAEFVLPSLKREPLFWSTLVHLVASEAITAFFVFGGGLGGASGAFKALRLEVDYVLRLKRHGDGIAWRPEKLPDLYLADIGSSKTNMEEAGSINEKNLIVQVDGKVRDRDVVSASIDNESLRAKVLSSSSVLKYINEKSEPKVFVARGKYILVNVSNKH